jgi:hypothetical protein
VHERGLAYALAAEHDNLGLEAVGHVEACRAAERLDVCEVRPGTVPARALWMELQRFVCVHSGPAAVLVSRETTKESDCRTSLMARGEERVAGERSRSHESRRRDTCACWLSQANSTVGE